MSELGKTEASLLAFGAAAAVAISGCTGESQDGAQHPSSTVSSSSEAAPLSPNVTPAQNQVSPDQVGALFDRGLEVAYKVSDVISQPDTIAPAYKDAAAIPNPYIRNTASTYISWRLAENTKYINLYTFEGENAVEADKDKIVTVSATINNIADQAIKATAQKNLVYQEADAAVKAANGAMTGPSTESYLESTVTDPALKAEVQAVIAGDQGARQKFDAEVSAAEKAVEQGSSDAFEALYSGSNSAATQLNKEIATLNQARHAAGD